MKDKFETHQLPPHNASLGQCGKVPQVPVDVDEVGDGGVKSQLGLQQDNIFQPSPGLLRPFHQIKEGMYVSFTSIFFVNYPKKLPPPLLKAGNELFRTGKDSS